MSGAIAAHCHSHSTCSVHISTGIRVGINAPLSMRHAIDADRRSILFFIFPVKGGKNLRLERRCFFVCQPASVRAIGDCSMQR